MYAIEKILTAFGIDYALPGSKNVSQGNIGVKCPFCDDQGYHGHFHLKKNIYNCWRCNPKVSFLNALVNILNIPYTEARELLNKYSIDNISKDKIYIKKSNFELPIDLQNTLSIKAKRYLKSRNFNPKKLINDWGIRSTGNIGPDSFRIFIPIYYKGKLVSYILRDITDKAFLRYKACPSNKAIIPHKELLYGFDKALLYKKCIVVEGVTDVWRLGTGAVATFGINFSNGQIHCLKKYFDEIYILYDNELQAQYQASKLANILKCFKKKVIICNLTKTNDPSELSNKEVRNFMKILNFI